MGKREGFSPSYHGDKGCILSYIYFGKKEKYYLTYVREREKELKESGNES